MLQNLPLEILHHIVSYLSDDFDLLSFRTTCKHAANAVRMCQRVVRWFPRADQTAFPWTPNKLVLNSYVPDDLFMTLLHSYKVVQIEYMELYLKLQWKPQSVLTTLVIEKFNGLVDFSEWKSLETLTLIKDVQRDDEAGVLKFPSSVRSVSLRYLTSPIDLSDCNNLESVLIENCVVYRFDVLSNVPKVHLVKILNPLDMQYLLNIDNLILNHCQADVPEYLNARTLSLIHTEWTHYPALPNIQSLCCMELNRPVIQADDLARCQSLTFVAFMPETVSVTNSWRIASSLLQYLCLEHCENLKQLPDLPVLEHLRLQHCDEVRLGQMPNLKVLYLRSTSVLGMGVLPELQTLEMYLPDLPSSRMHITGSQFPKLRTFKLGTKLRKPFYVYIQNLPCLRFVCVHTDYYYTTEGSHSCRTIVVIDRCWENLIDCFIMNFGVINLHYLARVHTVVLNRCEICNEQELEALRNVPNLGLSSCSISSARFFDHVRTLEISNSNVQDVSMLTTVRNLNIAGTTVTSLLNLRNIHTLCIDFTAVEDLTPLLHHQCLTYLSMNSTMVEFLEPLATIRTLRRVMAAECNYIKSADALQSVQSIDLNGCCNLMHVRFLVWAYFLDIRNCPKVLEEDILYLRLHVPCVQTDLNLEYENDGDIM